MDVHRLTALAGSQPWKEYSSKTPFAVAILILGLVKFYAQWGELPVALEPVELNDPVPDMMMDTNGAVIRGLAE